VRFASLVFLALFAQDSEVAPTSKLTSVALPAGALRALDPKNIAETSALLKLFYPESPVSASIEILIWAGDYGGAKGVTLREAVSKGVRKAGYEYQDAPSERKIEGRDISLCSAKSAARRVRGVWISNADGALLVWDEEPAAAAVGVSTCGNILYTPPKGWTVQTAEDTVTLIPNDLIGNEKLFVLLLPGREYHGKLDAEANELWLEACKLFAVEGKPWASEKTDVYRSFKGWDYFHFGTTVRQKDANLFLDVYFIHVGDRLERVAILTNWVNQPYQETPAQSPKYYNLLQDFVYGLQFKNQPDPRLPKPGLKGDGIVGVWVGMSLGTSGYTGRAEWKGYHVAFYDNGMALYTAQLPVRAFETMNPYVSREQSRRWWGTWSMDNGRGVLKMLYGEIPIVVDGANIVLTTNKTDHRFARLDDVDGTRWDGTYALHEYQGKIPAISFTPDGKFSDDGAVKILEHNLYKTYGIGHANGEGTYEVKNWTLLLHYLDGREYSMAYLGLVAKKGETKPSSINLTFNHDELKRR